MRSLAGKNIWMMGGAGIIASFLDEGQIDETRSAACDEALTRFRLQFLAVADDRTLQVVKENEVRARDAPQAIRQAVQIEWPPQAIGFKLIDQDGHEVFGRQNGDRGS